MSVSEDMLPNSYQKIRRTLTRITIRWSGEEKLHPQVTKDITSSGTQLGSSMESAQGCRLLGTTRHLIGPGACASKLGSITGLSEL
ncbi:unnamed protein product [Rhizophagus irregularis]|nr:unnamed protein product [Rhizophagus irregularis]